MRLKLRTLLALLCLTALVLTALPLSFAQEDDKAALIDQYYAAAEAARAYTSYTSSLESSQSQNQSVVQGETVLLSRVDELSLVAEKVVTRGDAPNGSYVATVEFSSESEQGGVANSIANTIEAELRYVDGVLYGRGTVTPEDGGLVLPAEFTEIIDVEANEFSDFLPVKDFWETLTSEYGPTLFDQRDLVEANISDVTSEEVEIEGETFTVITLLFQGEGLKNVLLATPDLGEQAAIFEYINLEESYVQTIAAVNADGLPVMHNSVMYLHVADIPGNVVGASADMLVSLIQFNDEYEELSDFNGEYPAVTLED